MSNRVILILILVFAFLSCASHHKIAAPDRDGSSYAAAIIVKSVKEEYEYVKKACQDCQLLGQSLSYHEKKPYDVLQLIDLNGKEVSYYFDISKFFGKGL